MTNELRKQLREEDLWDYAKDFDEPQIEIGTVGWDGVDEFYEKGTADNDGLTLIRVQLFRGRDYTVEKKPGVGQGIKVLCTMSSIFGFRIPPKGTRVYIACPKNMISCPGAPVIFASVEKNPTFQYDDDRVMLTYGDDKHIVIRAKSITLTDPDNRFMMIGTSRAGGDPGIIVQDETGSGIGVSSGKCAMMVASGGSVVSLIQMDSSEVQLLNTGGIGAALTLGSGKFVGVGNIIQLQGAQVYLGALPLATQGIIYGIPETSTPTLASTSVFVSQ